MNTACDNWFQDFDFTKLVKLISIPNFRTIIAKMEEINSILESDADINIEFWKGIAIICNQQQNTTNPSKWVCCFIFLLMFFSYHEFYTLFDPGLQQIIR